MTQLDCSALERAIAQLEKSYSYLDSDLSRQDPDLRDQFRAATVLAFEFTYEVAVKMIRRQLGQIVATPSALREMAFMDLIRTAADAGLVRDATPFKVYRELRNITSHTYDADKAEEIVQEIQAFLADVRFILAELQRRNPDGD